MFSRIYSAAYRITHGLFAGPWERLHGKVPHYAPEWGYWYHLGQNMIATWDLLYKGKYK
jgi:hypothetical protein